MHRALTDNAEHPEKVRQNILQVALDYLACGLDPEKATIFIQSMVPELTELTFYYMNLVTVSRVQRNPTVKAEIQMRNFEATIPVGFFLLSHQPGCGHYCIPCNCCSGWVKTSCRCWNSVRKSYISSTAFAGTP